MNKKILLSLIIFTVMIFAAPAFAQNQQNIALKAGYNFVSFTVVPAVTPQQLKTQYPSIEDIFFYHAYSGGFISLNEGTLVTLSAGKGYAIKSLQDITITVSGSLPGACGAIALVPEYNLVGFSKVPETITFGQLMARYSAIKGVYKWNFNAGVFVQVLRDGGGNIVLVDGVDPTITAGESYFINMQSQCDLSYDQAQIAITGENVTSTNISSMSVVNGKLTLNFTGAALPQALSISDFSVNVSINSSPYNWVIPVSVTRKSDTSAELILPLIQTSTTIDQLVAYKVAYLTNNPVFAPTFTIVKNTSGKVEAPVFSVPGGNYNTMQILTLTCPTPDAEIYCSIDGSEPVPYYGYKYYPGVFGPFVLLKNKTVKAIAVKRGMENSDVVTATYTMDIPPAVEIVNFGWDWQNTYQLLNAANGLQPLCAELSNSNPDSKLIFNLTEEDIVPLIVWKRNGKVVRLRLLQKMPKSSEIVAQGIVKINITANNGNLWFPFYSADALIALEKNLTSNSLQINSNSEVVNISSDFSYLSGTDIQLRDSIGSAVYTLDGIFNSNYVSQEVKDIIQPSFNFTATGVLNSFLTAIKHPQVKMFLDSTGLTRSITVNSLVINDQTASIPDDLLTSFQVTTIAPTISPFSQNTPVSSIYYFTNSQLVTLSCATPDAVIYYTVDDNVPTISSTLYTCPFTLTETKRVKAIAVKAGMKISPVSSIYFKRVGVIQSASAIRRADGMLELSIQADYAPSGNNYLVRLLDANANEVYQRQINLISDTQPISIYGPPVLTLYEKIVISYQIDYGMQPNLSLSNYEILKSQVTDLSVMPISISFDSIVFDPVLKKLSWTIPSGLPKPFYVSSCELTNNQGGMFSNSMIPMGTNFVDLPTGGTWPTATSFNVRLKLIMADTQIDLHDPAKSITGPETLKTFTLEGMPLSSIVSVNATNGVLHVFFNINPSPVTVPADFVIMQSIDGGTETIVLASVPINMLPMIDLFIPPVPSTTNIQTVSYRVSFKGGPFVASSTFSVPATTPSPLAPVMTPAPGTAATSVTLVTSTPGAAIYYKIVGQADTPTAQDIFSTGSVYNGPISLTEGVGIKIASVGAINGAFSEVVYGVYNVTLPLAPESGQ